MTKRQNSGAASDPAPAVGRPLVKTRKSRRVGAAVHSVDYRTSRPAQSASRIRLLGALAVLGALAGCVGLPPATVPTGTAALAPTEVVAEGDWDDADAAVRTAVRRNQMAIEARREFRAAGDADTTVLVYDLRTVRGDSGELMLRHAGDGEILVRCRIGAMGSANAERGVVESLVSRLRRLRGRDYAPTGG